MVWFVRKPNKRAAIVAGAVGTGLAALVAPQGPRTSWAHLEQQARWRAPHCVWPGSCPVTLRAASIGEAAFSFPLCSRSPWRARQKPLIACPSATERRPTGPCPLRRRKLRASRAGWREDLFPEKVSLPLSFPFESDVTTYSCARPMPGRAASRPAPRRKRPASSKALPMSCMPTGILLSAAMPTGRDRPGRPARFRDRV